MSTRRIAQRALRVDTSRLLHFTFDGQAYTGHPGDTLASALLANDIRLIARSFKYGRPRGIVGAGAEEPNALVQLELGEFTTPNLKATQVELYEGLRATRTSGRPSLAFDIKAIFGLAGRFMPAGFYSKTFKWPARFWPYYEKLIRSFSGYGRAPTHADTETYDHLHHHVDVLVVGAGLAGLIAARQAGAAGLKTLLIDEQAELGGWLLSEPSLLVDDMHADNWREQTLAALAAMPTVTMLARTTAFGLYDGNLMLAVELIQDHLPLANRKTASPRQRQHKIRARQVVLATGVIERPLVFGNNDRPGVMTMAAAQTYLNRYGVLIGKDVVITGGHDRIYDAAADLASGGARVTVVDHRAGKLQRRAPAGIKVHRGYGVVDVHGGQHVRSVTVKPLIAGSAGSLITASVKPLRLKADAVLSSAGLAPTVHLFCHDGGRPQWREDLQAFALPCDGREGIACVGSVTGAFEPDETVAQTMTAMAGVLAHFEQTAKSQPPPGPRIQSSVRQAPLYLVRVPDGHAEGLGAKAFVDYQNDVTAADIELAVRENYESIEHVKRYTALGFGTDQGKLSNVNGFILAAKALGKPVAQVGTTTYRPAYTPVSFGALAGARTGNTYEPARITPIHDWHTTAGAELENVGQWLRPWYFPKAGESMTDAVARECTAARTGVAIMDASTLGKIQLDGPDAREFMNRIYSNGWTKLAPGHCRYGLMLDENGMVMDDGVAACITDTQFYLTTTTGGAAKVLTWLETWHQTEWPELKLWISSVTDHLSTIAVVGPESRKVLSAMGTNIELSGEAFPFMTWRDGTLAGLPIRLMRVSFSGELAYEINVEAGFAQEMWQAVMDAGKPFDITPYGTESMHVLRAEKGFIIVGQDTDGSMTPFDLGMGWAVAMKKPFPFLGKRSLSRSDTARADRKQLVGLLPTDPAEVLPEGAQIVLKMSESRPTPMLGHVTSSYYSAYLKRSFALALVHSGRDRIGESLIAYARGKTIQVKVVEPVFVDPQGDHQRV